MYVLNFILNDRWICEARLVNHFHSLLNDVGMGWISHLKETLLLNEIHSVVLIQVRDDKVAYIGGRGLLQTARQFVEA